MANLKITLTTVATYGVLSLAAGGAFIMPQTLPQSVSAIPVPVEEQRDKRLGGKLFDFTSNHPDMEVTPSDGYGVYTGLVSQTLNPDGTMAYGGSGQKVLFSALD